ncbi:MAG: LysR family transcriptional regulator [Desulfobacteraceae bacterium]|nr:MAG: LysR family transcriptional regulator [Desulfobacteraceae bacterium]
MLNLNQLRVFYEAAGSGSFTAAARRLFITQPAVTAQVRLLEEKCSLKLFKKKGRNVYLTDEGKTLYEYIRKIFEVEKEVEQTIEDMRELKRGVLRLGTSKTYARYFMPYLITCFRNAYPHVKIHLDEGSSLDVLHSVLEFRNEVAVVAMVADNPDLCFIPFSKEELVLILAPTHPLAGKKQIAIEELAEEPVIAKERGSGTRKLVNGLFESEGLSPDILMETSNAEFIKQVVQRGEGVSFIVREAVAAELQDRKLVTVPIKGHRMYLDVSIAYPRKQPLSPCANAFLEILRKIIPKESHGQGMRTIIDRMSNELRH